MMLKSILRSWASHKALIIQIFIILTLGIGANVAVFTFFDSALLGLPFAHPSKLVVLLESNPQQDAGQAFISVTDFEDIERQSQSIESASLYDLDSAVLQTGSYPALGCRIRGFLYPGAPGNKGRSGRCLKERVKYSPSG